MTLSELIEQLGQLYIKHGDTAVGVPLDALGVGADIDDAIYSAEYGVVFLFAPHLLHYMTRLRKDLEAYQRAAAEKIALQPQPRIITSDHT